MNKVMCYEVNGFQIREYEKVKSTNEFMTFIDSGGKQHTKAKNCHNGFSPEYHEHIYYALKSIEKRALRQINDSFLKGGKDAQIALRIASEFVVKYPDIESLKEY